MGIHPLLLFIFPSHEVKGTPSFVESKIHVLEC